MRTILPQLRKYKLVLCFLLLTPLLLSFTARAEVLYQVQWPDRNLWLLGTIHLAAQSSTELTPKAKQAISTSQKLWMEITSDELEQSSALLFNAGLYDHPFLKEQLTEVLWDEFAALVARVGLAPSIVQRMEPWLAEYLIMVMWLRHEGFQSELGIDYQIMRYAALNDIQVFGLETADDQVRVLSQIRGEITPEAHVEEILQQFKTISAELAELEQSWQKGDLDEIWLLVSSQLSEYAQHILLVERNQQWLRTILLELKENEQHFMAVGAAHLGGEQGLLSLFERSGAVITKH